MTEAEQMDGGALVSVAPGIRRLVANNPGPLTFTGTNVHILGQDVVTVVDPGPDDAEHLRRLERAVADIRVSHILVTHHHRDHAPAAVPLARATGAVIVGPPALPGGVDAAVTGGETVETPAGALEVVATPGHTADHLAFALEGRVLLSGDHVMGWAPTVVIPPEGAMADYLASLERVAARGERLYLPGHGPSVADGPARARALLLHRRRREAEILGAVRDGHGSVEEILGAVYPALASNLRRAAGATVLAHLQHLAAGGAIAKAADGAFFAR